MSDEKCATPCLELRQLREREKKCPTMREAEARSLLRCVMECADLLGMMESASPRQVVERLRFVMEDRDRLLGDSCASL